MIKQDPLEKIEKTVEKLNTEAEKRTKSSFRKYPIIFSILITAAVVSILHGFELIFQKIPFIQNNPILLILFGFTILISTGQVYKKLDK